MDFKIIGLIVILCLVWGSLWGIIKLSLGIFPPFLFIAVRFIFAGLALILLQYVLAKSILPKRHEWPRIVVLSLLMCVGFYSTQTFAMQFVDSGLSAVLVFTMPIFIGILAHYFLNERLNTQKIIGLLFGLSGLIAILWPQLQHLHFNLAFMGQCLLIGSGLFWAISTIYIKKYFLHYDKIKLTAWQFILGGVGIFICALPFEPVNIHTWFNVKNAAILLYTAVIGTGAAFALWNWIVSQVDTLVASISIMSIPMISLALGVLFWHEPISFNIILGAVFICLGILSSALKTNKFKAPIQLSK